jgi:hypothetical protein
MPRYERPGISEQEVKDKVLKMTQKVCPKRYGVVFRKIRQLGGRPALWEADGTYRSPESDMPRRFTVRFTSHGTVRFKDIEPP